MKQGRRPILFALVLAVALGGAQALWRSGDRPPPEELVAWQAYDELGEPPYDGWTLLEFSADWCAPCRYLQVTVFRDPAFVRVLDEYRLRPVRLHYESVHELRWRDLSERYGVGGYPSMVLIAPDGNVSLPIEGALSVPEYAGEIAKRLTRMNNMLFWNGPGFKPERQKNRLVVRQFNTWWYVDRSQQRDWRVNPTQPFAAWIREYVDLVQAEYDNLPLGIADYRERNVRTVPTLIVEDWRGIEIARFEGLPQIERAPTEIARIARERNLEIPDPPQPYAERKRAAARNR